MCACSLFKAIFTQLKAVFYSGSINPHTRAKKLALAGKNNGKLLFIFLFTNHTDDYWPKILKKSALMF